MERLPLAQISGAVEKDAAAFFEMARGYAQDPIITLPPQKWVAKSREGGIIRRLDYWLFPFGPGAQLRIGGSCQALHFAKIVVAVAEGGAIGGCAFYAGVENGGGAAVVDGASGEAAVGVVPTWSGCEGDWKMTPVNHVFADGVSPVHVPPNGGVGVVLVKHVVGVVPEDGAVGVVHPILWRE